ncbi:hypothetical protein [Allobaculum mucilyticum]|uniref:hypothetical protein n=1 Tax=Allobaculum mucilyticum TaxID=2834459 RepID=UPI001E54C78A|nr:hypothetical protein [Allobaculum mucilyticum]UNT96649.1 hypothetical protein KWG62_02500 [Allobaculum mucilyticum]
MKYRTPLALGALALLLAGCQAQTSIPNSSEKLMTIGNKTVTKGDEYQILKKGSGTTGTLAIANRQIADKEIGVTDEIKKQAQETLDTYAEIEGFDDQLKQIGYDSADDYMNEVLIPNLQSQELTKKYFTDAKEDVITSFDPVLAVIIETDSEDNANKALEALKKGDDAGKVGGTYASEDATYTGTEQIITTQDSGLPETLRNAILDASKEEVLDQVFTNDTSTDDVTYYVAKVVSTDYDKNLDKIVSALSSNQTIASDCQIYYLKKYQFEVHDQDVFDAFKANNPEYLVTRPDLTEGKSDSQQ